MAMAAIRMGRYRGTPAAGADFFLQKWDALRMDTLGYSDTYGGGGPDNATAIARNRIGDIFVTGYTRSFELSVEERGAIVPEADGSGRGPVAAGRRGRALLLRHPRARPGTDPAGLWRQRQDLDDSPKTAA